MATDVETTEQYRARKAAAQRRSRARRRGEVIPDGRNLWTPQEDDYIRENFPNTFSYLVAEEMGRSVKAVRTRATRLGVLATDPHRQRHGSESPEWRGGDSKQKGGYFNRVTRWRVFERDDYLCLECGRFSPGGLHIVAHHIVPFRFHRDNGLHNLVTLCWKGRCHRAQAAHRWNDFWPERIGELPEYQQAIRAEVTR